MSDLVMWGLVAGFFLPPLLAIVQQPGWTPTVRALVMFVASILVAIGTVYFTDSGAFAADRLVTTILLVMVTAIATYKGLWTPTKIAPAIETATSPKRQT